MKRKPSPRSKSLHRKRSALPRPLVLRPRRPAAKPTPRGTDSARQYEVQLALLNTVSQGLASKLDFQGIIDLVGEKIRQIFDAQTIVFTLHDPRTNLTHFPYVVGPLEGKNQRLYPEPRPPAGFSGHVLKTRQPLVLNRDFDKWRKKYGSTLLGGTQHPKSGITVPILANDQAIGTISLQNFDREEAFPKSDVRLLTTLAANLGIAIQNARSFEAERQRAAELAVINRVQQALASKLDLQSIYDLVGDKIRDIFDAQVVAIATFDDSPSLIRYNYLVENRKRFYPEPAALSPFVARIIESRQTLVVRTRKEFDDLGAVTTPGTALSKSGIYVPLFVSGELRGGLSLQNLDRENAFAESDVRLLETLASSLSVALENARLFEAERQRVAELAVINSVQQGLASKLDLTSIYNLVGDKLYEVFQTECVQIVLYDSSRNLSYSPYCNEQGDRHTHELREPRGFFKKVIETGQMLWLNDITDQVRQEYGNVPPPGREPITAVVNVPLTSGGEIKGVISIQNINPQRKFSESDVRLLRTVASSMSVALENARLFDELQTRNREITQALEQQTATSEILRVIASSPTDIQPVLKVIAENAARVCGANDAHIYRVEGDVLKEWAHRGPIPGLAEGETLPRDRGSLIGRAIVDRQIVHIRDAATELSEKEYPVSWQLQRRWGYRTALSVPLLREDVAIGGIAIRRNDVQPFTDKQIGLLQTFADQAVIAIENVRLFSELESRNREITVALEQQTATSDILRVIAQSPTDIQPVLNVIAENARRLCDSNLATVYRTDGKMVYEVASSDVSVEVLKTAREVSSQSYPAPLSWDSTLSSRAILSRDIVHIPDLEQARDLPEITQRYVKAQILKSVLQVPMIREGEAIGCIGVGKRDPMPFTADQIALLQTFASQAVIAIENARLFDELQSRNREITIALEQQTATSEILRVMASSPTDVQPVLDEIAHNARHLLNGFFGAVYLRQGDMIDEVASNNYNVEGLRERARSYPRPLAYDSSVSSRVILDRAVQNIPDILGDPSLPDVTRRYSEALGMNSVVGVPMMREREAVGAIAVGRLEKGLFTEKQIALLKTFADQAVIAIENVRLFNETKRLLSETQQRAAELSIINSVQHGLASKLEMQAVYDLVGEKIREIFAADTTYILSYDSEKQLVYSHYYIHKDYHVPPQALPYGKGLYTYIIRSRQPLLADEETQIQLGATPVLTPGNEKGLSRTFLGVPILLGSEIKGVVSVQSDIENAYNDADVRLLQTLANSMSIALENAQLFDETQRLLKETEQRAAELAIINSVQQGLASKLDIQSIYDLVGDKLREIFDAQGAGIGIVDRARNLVVVKYLFEDGQVYRDRSFPLGQGMTSIVLETRQLLWINSEGDNKKYEDRMIFPGAQTPSKSWLTVPILIGGEAIGAMNVQNFERYHAFTEADVRLLQTLASSLGVALENARLFDETQRLLKETEQRAAELAIINSVQHGLASKSEMRAIYDLVGEKIRDIFDAQAVTITSYDLETGTSTSRYNIEKGQRFYPEPRRYGNIAKEMIRTRQPVVLQTTDELIATGAVVVPGTEQAKSAVYVPLVVGELVKGGISLQNIDREHAFSDSDVRLLQTLANSMSVALENARLFDAERERVAELAIINDVGQALAAQLDVQAVIDKVGDKILQVFDAQGISIRLYDEKANLVHYPYQSERGKRLQRPESRPPAGFTGHIIMTRQPLVVNGDIQKRRAELGGSVVAGEGAKSFLGVPIIIGEQVIGVIALENLDRENAFSDSDTRVLTTIAANMAVVMENARLFDEVQQRKEYFESVVQTSPVAIVLVDMEQAVVSWNPAAEQLFGYTRQEAVGRNLDELVATSPEIRADAVQYTPRSYRGQTHHTITRRNRRDGTLIDVELFGEVVHINGKPVGGVVLYHNITELQRARQAAEDANQAKSAFLATMSHEIRTPMNAVIGMSNLLLGTKLNAEQMEYAEIVRNSGDALLTIINDILDFSKIEAGRMDLESQPFDLRDVVESALDLVASRAAEKNLDLAYLMDENVPATVSGDATRLRQILLNLLSNAVKFTETGEVVLEVKAAGPDAQDQAKQNDLVAHPPVLKLHFSVRDTGIGIPPDRMGRLFESFSQVDASTSRKYGGTGLGLAISKRLAELMGGSMWAESEGVGKGSTFHCEISAQAAVDFVREARSLPIGEQPQLRGKRILIVDDNATNRRILTRQTQLWGMIPSETEFPRDALAMIARGDRFDLAILDMHMPEMDGVHLARAIRLSASPSVPMRSEAGLPLVLFSSLGRRELAPDDAIFAAYLTKPIKTSALFDTLVSILSRDEPLAQTEPAKMQLDPNLAERVPLRILLAEDNAVNQKLALRILSQMGYRADVAGNGIEAIEAVERQKYDLILMDVQMPEMDGLEATRQITQRLDRAARPRIVAMTANATQGDRELCLAAGMDDYIAKPIRVDELVSALTRTRG